MRSAVLVVSLVWATAACSKGNTEPSAEGLEVQEYDESFLDKVPTIGVAEAATLLAAGAGMPIDANSPRVRTRIGFVPGAVLLSDYETYNLAELPPDKAKTLVFYCSNKYCTASHEAAYKAMNAGYSVKVMEAGIAGWVAAGKQVTTL